ncbi:MAG: YidB family protein [Steroidobacteraceae bacterium]
MGLLDMLGNASGRRGGGISPVTLGLIGLLAYRTIKGKGRLADMLGTNAPAGAPGVAPAGSTTPDTRSGMGSLGGLGGLVAGGGLSTGLKDLLDRFRQAGHEKKAQSWVTTGPNESIAPHELEQALGEERLEWLVEQTGMSRDQLLTGLSGELPAAIDKLTPEGRLPTDDELAGQVTAAR